VDYNLGLAARRRFETNHGLGHRRRAHARDRRFQLRVATGIAAARISSKRRIADSSG
jgi:hypothetical protein